MVLTQKQKTSKNVTQTWYSPLPVVMEIDEISDEWGISKNKLLNLIAVFGLQNKDKLKQALLAEGRDSNQDPHHQPASPTPTTPTTLHEGTNSKEIEMR